MYIHTHGLQGSKAVWSAFDSLLLKHLGLNEVERNQVEGLFAGRGVTHGMGGLNEEQQICAIVARIAADPPLKVGEMQRLTACRLLRPL